jgi:hypothetical protein
MEKHVEEQDCKSGGKKPIGRLSPILKEHTEMGVE